MNKYFTVEKTGERVCCEFPKICPICNNSIDPVLISGFNNSDIKLTSFLFKCPGCGKGFLSHYKFTEFKEEHSNLRYTKIQYIESYPTEPEHKIFDDSINKVSKNFCNIYNQAKDAETYKLDRIAGMGYRKALEFLIKDYCIYRNEDKSDEIKKIPLSQVITTYIESEKIKKLAKATTWIGNDETHYVRIFEDKDIKDLKKFINATVSYIDYELISDEANELINS